MPPRKAKQPKDDDDHDEPKKTKKGKAVRPGGTMGMGRGHDEDDNGDPELDCEEGRLMQAKPMKKQKIDPARQERGGGDQEAHLPKTRRCLDCRCWPWSGGHRCTNGSQPQEPAKVRKPKKRDPPPPAPSEAGDSDTGDDISDEEDATGKRKASITQMLDEEQEEELADWWRDNPGLYDKSNKTYQRKACKGKLIGDKAAHMGVRGFDAAILASWMKSMRTIIARKRRSPKGRVVLLPLSSPHGNAGSSIPSPSFVHTLRLGRPGEYLDM